MEEERKGGGRKMGGREGGRRAMSGEQENSHYGNVRMDRLVLCP